MPLTIFAAATAIWGYRHGGVSHQRRISRNMIEFPILKAFFAWTKIVLPVLREFCLRLFFESNLSAAQLRSFRPVGVFRKSARKTRGRVLGGHLFTHVPAHVLSTGFAPRCTRMMYSLCPRFGAPAGRHGRAQTYMRRSTAGRPGLCSKLCLHCRYSL